MNPSFKHYTVYCTVPDIGTAEKLAGALVESKLAACVNILPGVKSVYSWKGEICADNELLLIIKTTADVYSSLERKILELHPYETPEIIALPICEGSADYLKWLSDSVSGDNE